MMMAILPRPELRRSRSLQDACTDGWFWTTAKGNDDKKQNNNHSKEDDSTFLMGGGAGGYWSDTTDHDDDDEDDDDSSCRLDGQRCFLQNNMEYSTASLLDASSWLQGLEFVEDDVEEDDEDHKLEEFVAGEDGDEDEDSVLSQDDDPAVPAQP